MSSKQQIARQEGQTSSCGDGTQIQCDNGGICKPGEKNYAAGIFYPKLPSAPFFNKTSYNNMYCECGSESLNNIFLVPGDVGYTGLFCNVFYTVCPDLSVCFYGSRCVQDLIKNTSRYYCDCPYAWTMNDRYAGVGCEYPGTSYCGNGNKPTYGFYDIDSFWFCTNNGICNDLEPNANKKCSCPPGFHGPHCEYMSTTSPPVHPNIPAVGQTCTLDCQNGGQCVFGTQHYGPLISTFMDQSTVGGMYCECPYGFTGVTCETPYEICNPNLIPSVLHPTRYCLNQGSCVDDDNNDWFCQCNNATGYQSFAGEHCEYKATVKCNPTVGNFAKEEFFCVNGGQCPLSETWNACTCPINFSGPRCEFRSNTKDTPPTCSLDCLNGGTCFFGEKREDEKYLQSLLVPWLSTDITHINGMHCKCPPGYSGLQCEVPVELCNRDNYATISWVCAYDSKCVLKGNSFACNCSTAGVVGSLTSYVGPYCQYGATSICKGPYTDPDVYFCTNDGECKADITKFNQPHPGCNCKSGFEGKMCELVVSSSTPSAIHEDKNKVIIAASVIVVLLALFCFGIIYKRNQRKRLASNPSDLDLDDSTNEDNREDIQTNIISKKDNKSEGIHDVQRHEEEMEFL